MFRESLAPVAAAATQRRKKRQRSAPRRQQSFEVVVNQLAERIRSLRLASGLTQQAASEAAQIETKHWQLLEAGGTNPTLATLVAVAKALGREPFELLKKQSD